MGDKAKSPPSTANKTVFTEVSPLDFIANAELTENRRKDALTLLQIMAEVTSEPPRMWGPSIIGFGSHHYKYPSGREGETPAAAFAPRKSQLVVYGLSDSPDAAPLLGKLGKFKGGVACTYINKLADIDLAVLRELIVLSYRETRQSQHKPQTQQTPQTSE